MTLLNRPLYLSLAQYQDWLRAGRITLDEVLARAVRLGVSGIEFRKEPWPAYAAEAPQMRARLAGLGLGATLASFNTLFSQDPAGFQAVRHDLETAQALGAPLLRIFSGAVPASSADPAWDQARALVNYAASLGLVLALENYGKKPGHTLAEVSRVLEEIPSPALQTNVDIGNYFLHGQEVTSAIQALGPRVGYAHLKDQPANLQEPPTYLGGGAIPLGPILDALDRLPQTLIYCFEFVGGENPDDRIARSLAFLHARA